MADRNVSRASAFRHGHVEIGGVIKSAFGTRDAVAFFVGSSWRPPTDVIERDDAFIVRMELAGVTAEDVRVHIAADVLTVSGQREELSSDRPCTYHQMEIRRGYFERRIALPQHVDQDGVRASYNCGFLEVFIPKARPPGPVEVSIVEE